MKNLQRYNKRLARLLILSLLVTFISPIFFSKYLFYISIFSIIMLIFIFIFTFLNKHESIRININNAKRIIASILASAILAIIIHDNFVVFIEQTPILFFITIGLYLLLIVIFPYDLFNKINIHR